MMCALEDTFLTHMTLFVECVHAALYGSVNLTDVQ